MDKIISMNSKELIRFFLLKKKDDSNVERNLNLVCQHMEMLYIESGKFQHSLFPEDFKLHFHFQIHCAVKLCDIQKYV